MMAVIIIRPHITRLLITITATRILITNRHIVARLYGQASVTTTATTRATTPPTGIDLRHALDDASVPSATGECADAPKRVIKGTQDFPRAVATALSAVTEHTTSANQASQRRGQKIYLNLALFVCAVVIK
jgi:hypothetical protein